MRTGRRLFYFYIFVLMLSKKSIPVHAQLVIVESGMDKVANGATQLYSANYARQFDASTEILNWRLNEAAVVQIIFEPSSMSATLNNITTDSRFFGSVSENSSNYSLELKIFDVSLSDSGTIDIYRITPSQSLLGSFSALVVQLCNSSSGGDKEHIDIDMLEPSSFNQVVNVSCVDNFRGTINMTCLADATWSKNENCTEVATTIEPTDSTGDPASSTDSVNGSEPDTTTTTASNLNGTDGDGLTEAYKAGISITVLYAACVVVALILIFALEFELMAIGTPLIILFIVGSVLVITGIIMCFTGTDPGEDMDAVEIAGTVLGSLGLACCVAGLIWLGIEGSPKDYEPGAAKK